MSPEKLLDQPYASGAVNALNIQVDAGDAAFSGPFLFDQLQPLVVDSAGLEVRGRKSRAASQLIVAGEAGFREDSMDRATTPAAVRRKGVIE